MWPDCAANARRREDTIRSTAWGALFFRKALRAKNACMQMTRFGDGIGKANHPDALTRRWRNVVQRRRCRRKRGQVHRIGASDGVY